MPAGNFEPAGFDWEHRNLKSFLDQQRQVQNRMSALRAEQDRVVKSFNTGATVIRRNIGKINTSVSRLKTRSITNYKRSVRSIPETWEDAARRVEAASARINNAGGFGASFRGGGGTRGRGGAAGSQGGGASRTGFGSNADPRLRVLEELAASQEYNPGASAFQRQRAVDQTIRQFEGDNIHRAFRDNLEKVVDELEKYRREIRETREVEERTREQRSALRLQARGAGLSGEQVAAAETRAQSSANLTRESRRLQTELNKDVRAHQRVERAQQKAVDQRRENIRAIARERRELINANPEHERLIRSIARERLAYEQLTPARRRARTELTRSLDARRQFGQQGGRLERGLTGLSEKLHRAGRATGGYYTGIGRAAQAGSELIGGLGGVAAAINPVTVGLVAATAAGAAFFGLASRAAAHEGLIDAFQRTGVSLERLREGSKGYVADITLMRQANLALTGTTGMIRTLLRDNLHKFAEIAAAQARDTGQDVTYLYNSLIEGFKRSSPRIIDNTGLVVKLGQANKDLATELGKTTQQLTQQEQQAALLQAILKAGERSVRENADAQETSAQKLQKIGATITNIFDKIGFALQPLFSQLLEEAYRVIRPLEDAAPKIGQVLSSIVQLIVQAAHGFVQLAKTTFGFFQFVFRLGTSFLGPTDKSLSDTHDNIGDFVRESLFSFNRFFGTFQANLSKVFSGLPIFVRDALGLTTDEIDDSAEEMGSGYIKALTKGMLGELPVFRMTLDLFSANMKTNSPAPRVGPLKDLHIHGFNVGAGYMNEFNSALAQGYATTHSILNRLGRMLIGRSPPPDGPLRFLDTGGKNAALAWIDAFIGQDLQPFETVASNVIKAMGRVATFTKEQVTGRLGELDTIQHAYNDQLNITKARFEALKGPADRAIAAIDRNIERRLQDIASGDRAAAAIAREFDLRRDRIYEAVDAQQILIDEAEVQLGLVKAQQAEERVLLNIRKRAFDEARRAAGAGGPDVPGFTDPGDLEPGERGELPGFNRAANVFYEAELERLRAYLAAGGRREDLAYFGFSKEVIADYDNRRRGLGSPPPFYLEALNAATGPGTRTRTPILIPDNLIDSSNFYEQTIAEPGVPGQYGRPLTLAESLAAVVEHNKRIEEAQAERRRKQEAAEAKEREDRLERERLANYRIQEELRLHYSQLATTQNEALTKQENRQATFTTVNRGHIDDYIEDLTGGDDSLKASIAAFFGGSSPDSWSYYLDKGALDTGEFVAQVTAHYNAIIAKARETARELATITFTPSRGFSGIPFGFPGDVPGFARGGVAGPGFFIAGEEGPELILTQRQLAVIPADVTRELRAFASGVSEYRAPSAPRGGGSTVSNSSQVINNNFVVPDNVDLVRRLRMNGIG